MALVYGRPWPQTVLKRGSTHRTNKLRSRSEINPQQLKCLRESWPAGLARPFDAKDGINELTGTYLQRVVTALPASALRRRATSSALGCD